MGNRNGLVTEHSLFRRSQTGSDGQSNLQLQPRESGWKCSLQDSLNKMLELLRPGAARKTSNTQIVRVEQKPQIRVSRYKDEVNETMR